MVMSPRHLSVIPVVCAIMPPSYAKLYFNIDRLLIQPRPAHEVQGHTDM